MTAYRGKRIGMCYLLKRKLEDREDLIRSAEFCSMSDTYNTNNTTEASSKCCARKVFVTVAFQFRTEIDARSYMGTLLPSLLFQFSFTAAALLRCFLSDTEMCFTCFSPNQNIKFCIKSLERVSEERQNKLHLGNENVFHNLIYKHASLTNVFYLFFFLQRPVRK